jgi:C-terminal processing protease CtpA/Prc
MSMLKTAKLVIFLTVVLSLIVSGFALAGDKNEQNGYLGVMLQSISSNMAEAMDLDDEDGVLVSEVVEDGPADLAGLEDGDIIIAFNGKNIASHKSLTKAVGSSSPGDVVDLVVLRDGKKKTIEVELGEREDPHVYLQTGHRKLGKDFFVWNDGGDEDIEIMVNGMKFMNEDRGFMGVELDDLNEQMGRYFEVEDGNGALITSVNEDSAAEKAGLRAGDVIVQMGDEEIQSASDVHSAMAGTEPDEELQLTVIRKGTEKDINITLGEAPAFGGVSPKMLYHGMPKGYHKVPKMMHKEMRVIHEGENDLKEMRHELEKMKKELKKMKEELKK